MDESFWKMVKEQEVLTKKYTRGQLRLIKKYCPEFTYKPVETMTNTERHEITEAGELKVFELYKLDETITQQYKQEAIRLKFTYARDPSLEYDLDYSNY